jgi:mono/diheme cytochrome c family protein
MKVTYTLTGIVAASLLVAGLWIGFVGHAATPDTGARAQIERGRVIYSQNCASCHGANLEGQADWQIRKTDGKLPAPPHDATGHTWHHSDRQLSDLTKHGLKDIVPGYESDMPAFESVLNDAEIASVLAYIKSTWPSIRDKQQGLSKATPQ